MSGLFGDLPEALKPLAGDNAGAARLREPDRRQAELQLCDLEQLISADHPARVFWAYVCALDLSALDGRVKSREGRPGHPALPAKLALALWLYAFSDGVGSARELERLCLSEAAYRWLCGGVSVNHHTLSDFRTGERALIDRLLVEHVAALARAGLIDLDEIAQDGVRVRAGAGAASFRRRKTLEAKAAAALAVLAADEAAGPGASAERRQAKARRAAERQAAKVAHALRELKKLEAQREERAKTHKASAAKQKEPRASTTDPEARVMKMADGGFRPAYNIQIASLPASGIVLAVSAGNAGSDRGLATPMREKTAKAHGVKPRRWLADGGFQAKGCIEAAAADGVGFYCPPGESKQGGDPYAPKRGDTPAIAEWRKRMQTDEAKAIYRRRAIGELRNAVLTNLNLHKLILRGLAKAETVMIWFALSTNILTGHRLEAERNA